MMWFFFFKVTATTEIYTYCHTLSRHDALPIWQVVGGDLRARDEDALLAVEHVLAAAAEEEGDVRVLLGLGDAHLLQAGLCRQFAERVAQVVEIGRAPV